MLNQSTQAKIDQLIKIANNHFCDKNLVESLVEYSRALDLFDLLDKYYKVQKQEIQVRIAICYDLLGNFKKAECYVSKALETVPNFPYLILYRSVLYLVNGSSDKANIELIKYRQLTLGKSVIIFETFRLLYYFILEFDMEVILNEINEISEKYELNSFLLLLRASVYLHKFYQANPEISAANQQQNQSETVNSQCNNISNSNYMANCGSKHSMEVEFNFLMSTFRKSKEPGISKASKEDDSQSNLMKLKLNDKFYIKYKADIEEIINIQTKENSEFLLKEGISLDSITKLFFLAVQEMEDIEPKALISYKSFFSGLSVFYVVFKAIKILKIKLLRKKLKNKYSNEISKLSLASPASHDNNSKCKVEGNYQATNKPLTIIERKAQDLKTEYEKAVCSLYSSPFLANIKYSRKEFAFTNDNSSLTNPNNQASNISNTNTKCNSNNYSSATSEVPVTLKIKFSSAKENYFIEHYHYSGININRRLIKEYKKEEFNRVEINPTTSREGKLKLISGRNIILNEDPNMRPSQLSEKKYTPNHNFVNKDNKSQHIIYNSSLDSNNLHYKENSNMSDKVNNSNSTFRNNSTLQMKCGEFKFGSIKASYNNSSGEFGQDLAESSSKSKIKDLNHGALIPLTEGGSLSCTIQSCHTNKEKSSQIGSLIEDRADLQTKSKQQLNTKK